MSSDEAATRDRMQWVRLIGAIATRQDRAAFAALFEYFAPRIKAFMQRSGVSEANAEELAQETMLVVWRKAALFDPASSGAAAWIFTIARNLRIDAYRRERRGGVIEASDVEIEFQIDDSPQPDSRLATSQSEERVRSVLSKLPADQMRVIELSFFEEKAHADIAQILGIPLGTVKSRLRLAMSRLRTLLSELL
jgi:RNA polymerase sigma-70 factor (ECF subfamily)